MFLVTGWTSFAVRSTDGGPCWLITHVPYPSYNIESSLWPSVCPGMGFRWRMGGCKRAGVSGSLQTGVIARLRSVNAQSPAFVFMMWMWGGLAKCHRGSVHVVFFMSFFMYMCLCVCRGACVKCFCCICVCLPKGIFLFMSLCLCVCLVCLHCASCVCACCLRVDLWPMVPQTVWL